MPTYEYECEGCRQRFERRQGITEEPIRVCPACGGTVRRLLSGGAGILVREGGGRPPHRDPGGCRLERAGSTCCGRAERCGAAPCGEER